MNKLVMTLSLLFTLIGTAEARNVELQCYGEEPMFHLSINSYSGDFAFTFKLPQENESAAFEVLRWNKSLFSSRMNPALRQTRGELFINQVEIEKADALDCQEIKGEDKFKIAMRLNGHPIEGCCTGWSTLLIQSGE